MRITARFKTFRGHEFAIAAIQSVYKHVDEIILICSETGWTGRQGNTVRPTVEAWVASGGDTDHKVHFVDTDGVTAEEQQTAAQKWMENRPQHPDYVMLIDTDEVWDEEMLARSVDILTRSRNHHDAYFCRCHTYMRSPMYRVTPMAQIRPTVFVRWGVALKGVRGVELPDRVELPTIHMHHFCSVRESLSEVMAKHRASCGAESQPMVAAEKWVADKWNSLPKGSDLLPLTNYAHDWAAVEVVTREQLPATVRNMPLVMAFEQYRTADVRMPVEVMGAAKKVVAHVKEERKSRFNSHAGKLTILVACDEAYKWYLPMFLFCARRALPAKAEIAVFTDAELPEGCDGCTIIKPWGLEIAGDRMRPLRFLHLMDAIRAKPYVLMTDIDIMLRKEDVPIIDQHMHHLEHDGTSCYENWVAEPSGAARLSGVHFITDGWWAATHEAREEESRKFTEGLSVNTPVPWNYDEIMLARIVTKSGLPLPPTTPKLWRNHGIHMGAGRLSGKGPAGFSADESSLAAELLADAQFVRLAEYASVNIPWVKKVVGKWRALLR